MTSTWVLKTKSAAELPQRLRTAALTSNEREYALEMAHLIAVVGMNRHHSIRERCTKFMRSLMLSFCQSMVIDVRFSKIQHYNRGFDYFSYSWILSNTRFRNKHDCRLAFLSLKLPAERFILSNRARASSAEEAWLVTLREPPQKDRASSLPGISPRPAHEDLQPSPPGPSASLLPHHCS